MSARQVNKKTSVLGFFYGCGTTHEKIIITAIIILAGCDEGQTGDTAEQSNACDDPSLNDSNRDTVTTADEDI